MGIADWLRGCAHRRKSFPMSPRHVVKRDGKPPAQQEVYVVCLDCGRRFTYDWNTMKVKKTQGGTHPFARKVGNIR